MKENIKTNEENIIQNISLLKENKNPLNVFFILADLKDLFISIGETLLNSIEESYSEKSQKQYINILHTYTDAGIFEAIYNYYLNNDGILRFKKDIDNYFHNSFFYDISFFYFTISRKDVYRIIFDVIEVFYSDTQIRNTYFSFDTYAEKKVFLDSISLDFLSLKFEKDIYFIIKFLNYFQTFDFSQVTLHFNNTIPSNVKIMKEITLKVFADSQKYTQICDLFLSTFVFDEKIHDEILETLEEKKLFEVISFLKTDILSAISYHFPLDYQSKLKISRLLVRARNLKNLEMEEKIKFLIEKENAFISIGAEKGDFARISFKRQFLESKFPDIIDLTMGINALPQDVFYLLKRKNGTLNLAEFTIYNEVKDLILYIEKSYFLSLARPFLLKNIGEYFNYTDQKYYIIKFILSIVLTSSYSEYQKISKFFYNLESFYKKDFSSFISRIFQFGWIVILFFILIFIAPFGLLLAGIILLLRAVFLDLIFQWNPKIKMSLNFQIGSFAALLGIFSLVLSTTIGYNENVDIIYKKFSYLINSISLPSSESWKALYGDTSSLKADIIGSK